MALVDTRNEGGEKPGADGSQVSFVELPNENSMRSMWGFLVWIKATALRAKQDSETFKCVPSTDCDLVQKEIARGAFGTDSDTTEAGCNSSGSSSNSGSSWGSSNGENSSTCSEDMATATGSSAADVFRIPPVAPRLQTQPMGHNEIDAARGTREYYGLAPTVSTCWCYQYGGLLEEASVCGSSRKVDRRDRSNSFMERRRVCGCVSKARGGKGSNKRNGTGTMVLRERSRRSPPRFCSLDEHLRSSVSNVSSPPPSSPSTCAVHLDGTERFTRPSGSLWCFSWGGTSRRRRHRKPHRQENTKEILSHNYLTCAGNENEEFYASLDRSGSLSFKSLRSRTGCSCSKEEMVLSGEANRIRKERETQPIGRISEGLLSFLKAASWGNSFTKREYSKRTHNIETRKSYCSNVELDSGLQSRSSIRDDSTEFFSVEGDNFDWEGLTHGLLGHDESTSTATKKNSLIDRSEIRAVTPAHCSCGFACHLMVYDQRMPLHSGPTFEGSYEERLAIARALRGHWITIVERSESLDPQYKLLGLGMVKRAVMNRLAVPLTMFLENNDTVLHCWIHTPLGIRHMCSNLEGKESIDDDPDAGRWIGTTAVVNYSIPWFCGGTPVRALQQTRHNPKIGTSVETRCVLPDSEHGKVMLFNFLMYPKGKPETAKLSADRILYLESEDVS